MKRRVHRALLVGLSGEINASANLLCSTLSANTNLSLSLFVAASSATLQTQMETTSTSKQTSGPQEDTVWTAWTKEVTRLGSAGRAVRPFLIRTLWIGAI